MTALASPDEEVARSALGYLFDGSRAFLDRHLQSTCNVRDPQVRADLAQTSFLRLWSSRGTFRNQGDLAWHGWLQRTASNCYVDYLRSNRRLANEEEFDLEAIPPDERPIIDAVLTAIESDAVFRVADILFLELDSDLTPRMHERRLLAAQLFYVDGESWQSIMRLLGSPPPGEPALTREELDRWLANPGVLRHLAFRTLFYDGDRLAAHLLGWTKMPSHQRAQALDALLKEGLSAKVEELCDATDKELTWASVLVLLWRFRHALLIEQIRARTDQTLTEEQFRTLLERCAADFPFMGQMQEIVAATVPDGSGAVRKSLFAATGLWQRLVLEYRFREDLPHRDILDRVRPAADVVGYEMTAGMLNVWLSNGRLVKRLAQKFRELHGDFEGETQYA